MSQINNPISFAGWLFGLFTSAPNDVVPVAAAEAFDGVSFNDQVDVAIVPSGGPGGVIGALSLQVPDGTAAGGNKRGQGSIDLQLGRNAATSVTSAPNSFALGFDNEVDASETVAVGISNVIAVNAGHGTVVLGEFNNATAGQGAAAIGKGNTVSDDAAVAFGEGNMASAEAAVALGKGNAVSGQGAAAIGRSNIVSGASASAFGQSNTADSFASTAEGFGAVTRGVQYADVFGYAGPQRGHYGLQGTTTDATPLVLTGDGGAAGTTNQVILPVNSAFVFHGKVVARDTGNGNVTAWEFNGAIKQGANAAATAIVPIAVTNPWGVNGLQIIAQDAGMAGVSIALSADTTNGALSVTATGLAGENIDWFCDVQTGEVT